MDILNLLIKGRIYAEGIVSNWIIEKLSKYPEAVQKTRLLKIIRANRDTDYGKAHDFYKIKSVEDFRRSVPMNEYEDLRPWFEKADQTNAKTITSEQPLRYAVTSGTTGKPKYIPVLESTLRRQKLIQHL